MQVFLFLHINRKYERTVEIKYSYKYILIRKTSAGPLKWSVEKVYKLSHRPAKDTISSYISHTQNAIHLWRQTRERKKWYTAWQAENVKLVRQNYQCQFVIPHECVSQRDIYPAPHYSALWVTEWGFYRGVLCVRQTSESLCAGRYRLIL